MILFFVVFGYFLTIKYQERNDFYAGFFLFNKLFINNLQFENQPIKKFIESNNKNFFYTFLEKYLSENVNKTKKIHFLTNEEFDYFCEYVSLLGKSDTDSQLKYFSNQNSFLEEKTKKTSLELKKYRPMIIKLSFLFGLIFLIIII